MYIRRETMVYQTGADHTLAEAISRLAYCNPFLPERIDAERQRLQIDLDPLDRFGRVPRWNSQQRY